jgi:hypothetical protein
MRIRIQLLTLLRIWIPGSIFKPPGLHFERPRPSTAPFSASKAPEFRLQYVSNPAFYSNSDSDAASKNNADPDPQPCFSLTVLILTLVGILVFFCFFVCTATASHW